MSRKVQTVLGEVSASDLGVVLPHEHFNAGIKKVFYKPGPAGVWSQHEDSEFKMENLGWIRQHPYSHKGNMFFEGTEVDNSIVAEVKKFKEAGGRTIVENTSNGLGRNLSLCKRVAQETGVHIIVGTGFYVHASQDKEILPSTQEFLANLIEKELTEGCLDDPSIRCGYIGEIGCSWPVTDFEKNSIRASGEVASKLNSAVMIHPGRDSKAPEEIMRIYMEAGGDPKRAVMGHLDRTIHKVEELLEFSKIGTFLEFDLFGIETSLYQQNLDVFMPSDGERITRIQALMEEGCEDRILISHDIHTRHRLEHFGGHGFNHILNCVLPMMSRKGFSKQQIHKLTTANPAAWLCPQK